MTEFFFDAHPEYQKDVDFGLAARQGMHGGIVKFSEGEGIRYPGSGPMVDRIAAAGMGTMAYHWLHAGDKDYAKRQVENLRRALGDRELGVMLDWEKPSGKLLRNPQLSDAVWFVEEAVTRGVDMRAIYLPRWYWAGFIGRPNLNIAPFEKLALVNSAYGANVVAPPAQAFQQNQSEGAWDTMGGKSVTFLQFGEHVLVGGTPMDCNAYRGDAAALQRFFGMQDSATRVSRARRRLDRAEQDLGTALALLNEAVANERDDAADGTRQVARSLSRLRKGLEELPER